MTVNQAHDLAKLAHAGQFRRAREMTQLEYKNFTAMPEHVSDVYITNSGSAITRGGKEFGYEYIIKEPYITHPEAVAHMMTTDEEKIIALLHDVIEDTDAELIRSDGLRINFNGNNYYISDNIYNALQVLTKTPDIKNYNFYINKIATLHYFDLELIPAQELAIKVKIADITCNLLEEPSENQRSKYRAAMQVLLGAL